MENQKHLIHELDREEGNSWLLFLDAGRADYFQELYEEYGNLADGDYQTVYNNGNQGTKRWFKDIFSYSVDGHLFHAGSPIKKMVKNVKYDEDECFARVPSASIYDVFYINDSVAVTDPESVNEVVEQHLPDDSPVSDRLKNLGYVPSGDPEPNFNMNVVRYMQPHAPYRELDHIDDHLAGIRDNIGSELTHDDLRDAYQDNYRWGLEYVNELIDVIDPHADNIVVTSDHGECLGDCGEWFHGTGEHDHLLNVPWLRVK
jgi:hypothetical protein